MLASLSSAFSEPFTAGLTALSREHATTAFRAWMKVAENGDPEGKTMLHSFMNEDWGLFRIIKKLKPEHMLASAQGLPSAKHNLAMLTYKGHINNKDWRKSIE